ncbi:glutaminase A [Nocardioides sp. L-11A]|uniref:glutaminase A n=1 Tax=Nocardioides sp. L-11A TaxID=3043848 RepID=UPI00249CC1D2|nr:glutaminase A [Nocardioides sp. L-11A]
MSTCGVTEGRSAVGRPADALVEHAHAAAEHGRAAATTGEVSAQIPELSRVDPDRFGLAVALLDGTEIQVGDADRPFSLQSVTKLFALCALLRDEPTAWEHVGWDASGAGYGSVSELETHAGRPRNPFVNAGALVVTDRLLHHTGDAAGAVTDLLRDLGGEHVQRDRRVALSEAAHDHRNRAIAHVLAEHGRLLHGVDAVLAQYFEQCSITASALAVARAALLLADRTGARGPLDAAAVRRVNAVLLTAGMYGAAGDIAYRVGLPAKSGIGGGVVAVLPGVGSICVWSPRLDRAGNSTGAVAAIEEFARLAGWSVF